jgi:hypothetical protein
MDKKQLTRHCEQIVGHYLELLSRQLVTALRPMVRAKRDPHTHHLEFEVFSEAFASRFPVVCFPITIDPKTEEPAALPVAEKVLPGVPFTIPESVICLQAYEAADVDTWRISFRLTVPWFAKSWRAAGGDKCKWPAYIGHHDSDRMFDMKRRRWVMDDEIGP